ncbi:hypothetical protein CI15_06350 [Paraburkholderia monticola]|uniref:Uncharacterized protein n=1 Tax=Paraburkholderia monticola TaxID=1399968 RepID=A0A149PXM2_9BURK|nr:ATP-binding protein [Paraburkholderia monticola]KXU89805.1 hypothetical protein CI15_06350 [Paraburkholderia monticola]
MTTIDFQTIRAEPKSKRDSFEALSILLFQRTTDVPPGSEFVAIRGDGGDGGVEAFFRTPGDGVVGLQAKYFFKLGNGEFSQIKDSYKTALANYPDLTEYYVYIPFDLTGKRSAGAHGRSETERFEDWRVKMRIASFALGHPVEIHLVPESLVREKLLTIDSHGGYRRYWFGEAALTKAQIVSGLEQAKAFAGPRHSSLVDVATEAHEALDFFGRVLSPDGWVVENVRPYRHAFASLAQASAELFSLLDALDKKKAKQLLSSVNNAFTQMRSPGFVVNHSDELEAHLELLLPLMETAEHKHYEKFCSLHGEENDNPHFRQFQAEMMAALPAGILDMCREALKDISEVLSRLRSPAVNASRAQSLLLVGPPGIGKTHELVAAANRRLTAEGLSLVVFGEDFRDGQPWEVVRTKLGFGASVGRGELFECISASAASTRLPFVIYIDALNETPDAARWRDRLPEFLQQIANYPNILVCVSTRDTYRDLVVDERFPGFAFNHRGFEGRQAEALEAFCAAYQIESEITPLFSEELVNPLLLHLACKTIKAGGGKNLDLSAPGFDNLFNSYLDVCDSAIRRKRGWSNPVNLVRRSLRELAEVWACDPAGAINYEVAVSTLNSVLSGDVHASVMLEELQREGLLIVSEVVRDEWVVRFAYQKFSDSLVAANILESCSAGDEVNLKLLGNSLSKLCPENAGLVEAIASVLPEKTNVEITDYRLALPHAVSMPAFLRSITFRSRKSITSATVDVIKACLKQQELWRSAYETLFKTAMIPECAINAKWLHSCLNGRSLVGRDALLSTFLTSSFEEQGVVHAIVDAALRSDVSRWPDESRELLAIVLLWVTSSADRRVRDRSTKALTRVISLYPALGLSLVHLFEGSDDDYILESLTLAIYCGSLLAPSNRQQDFIAILEKLATPGFAIPNVMVRDSVRMLAMALSESVGIPAELQARAIAFCAPFYLPEKWPTYSDATAFTSIEGLPPNMDLSEQWGTDFKRYVLESKMHDFDLASMGITIENVASWIMLETLRLGYPGPKGIAYAHEYPLHNRHGSGRGRPGYAERLGKKYFWISLHRLVGLLARNVPPKTWNDDVTVAEMPEYFWSINLRKVDVTDVRDISGPRSYDERVVGDARYHFPDASEISDLNWVKADDLTPHKECLHRRSSDGADWVALAFYAHDDEREDSAYSRDSRYITVDYSSFIIDKAKQLTARYLDNTHAFSSHGNHCYRAFFGEYPRASAFHQCALSDSVALAADGDLTYADVELLRGVEWEYDYAANERQANLSVPAPALVEHLGLVWDRQSGWLDEAGVLAAFSLTAELRSGLYIRRDLLDRYLRESGSHLLYARFHNRGRTDGPASDAWSFVRYDGRHLKVIHQSVSVFEG